MQKRHLKANLGPISCFQALLPTRCECCNMNSSNELGQYDPVAQLEEQLTFNQ